MTTASYVYVVDAFVNDPKYQTELIRIESRMAGLGLPGRWEKMTILKSLRDATADAIKRGATTVIAVGNDQTVTKILPLIVDRGVTLGLLPIGPDQFIAEALGIPHGVAACDCLSRRIIQRVDVGQANGNYFLLRLSANGMTSVTCDGKYTVSSLDPEGQLEITNLGSEVGVGQPNDGRLELVVRPSQPSGMFSRWRNDFSRTSVFPIRRAKIEGAAATTNLLLDGQTVVKAPLTVETLPKKLSVIVGPNRRF